MQKTKIDWCDYVFNPVWGCLNNCEYCYARKIAKRFGNKICGRNDFKPTWIESNFQKPFPKKPSRIFVNSMSGLEWWQFNWLEKVLNKIEKYPQHVFIILLSRNGTVYFNYFYPKNCLLGITATTQIQFNCAFNNLRNNIENNSVFISIEPITERIEMPYNYYTDDLQWIIIGSETGNRSNKIIPKKEWILEIKDFCNKNKIPLFMKESLRGLMGNDFIQEFSELLNKEKS